MVKGSLYGMVTTCVFKHPNLATWHSLEGPGLIKHWQCPSRSPVSNLLTNYINISQGLASIIRKELILISHKATCKRVCTCMGKSSNIHTEKLLRNHSIKNQDEDASTTRYHCSYKGKLRQMEETVPATNRLWNMNFRPPYLPIETGVFFGADWHPVEGSTIPQKRSFECHVKLTALRDIQILPTTNCKAISSPWITGKKNYIKKHSKFTVSHNIIKKIHWDIKTKPSNQNSLLFLDGFLRICFFKRKKSTNLPRSTSHEGGKVLRSNRKIRPTIFVPETRTTASKRRLRNKHRYFVCLFFLCVCVWWNCWCSFLYWG